LKQRLRLHILTGFLGSGKSTLLRRYLHTSPAAQNTVVLINEFGAVAIDHTLVRTVSVQGLSLTGGCACCEGDDELRAALLQVLTQVEREELKDIQDIILETSGVADPSRIIGTVAAEMHLGEYLQLASCCTVVEAGTDALFLERFPEVRNQIACANQIVLSKCDQHGADEVAATRALVCELNPLAEILPSGHTADIGSLFASMAPVQTDIAPMPQSHHSKFTSFQIEVGQHLQWPAFSVWLTSLLHCHGHNILRFKGVIALDDSTALVLQGVRHRVYEPEHLDLTVPAPVRYGLVFICDGEYEAPVREGLRRFEAACSRHQLSANIRDGRAPHAA
jgi:G3E family GTPase